MKNKGFTLIELLVVIAIIGLLSSIVFASISSAREKAQITKANVELKELKKAVELSRISANRLPVQTNIAEPYNESSAIYDDLSEYISQPPEIGSMISGDDPGDNNLIYISNGETAKDSEGVDYYCRGELNEYVIMYKVEKSYFDLYYFVGTEALFDGYGNDVASFDSPISSISYYGTATMQGHDPPPVDSPEGTTGRFMFGNHIGGEVGYYVCL